MNRDQLPPRLAARPFDDRRGLPIPYVSDHSGQIDFAAVNGARLLDCVRLGLCSACGQPHEHVLAFIGGPGGFAMRRYTDPPMHPQCADWSLRLCPYLALHRHRRRGTTEHTAAPGFTQMEKADPVILATTSGYHLQLAYDNTDRLPGLVFIPRPWITATSFEYRGDALTEVGPEPIPAPEAKP